MTNKKLYLQKNIKQKLYLTTTAGELAAHLAKYPRDYPVAKALEDLKEILSKPSGAR